MFILCEKVGQLCQYDGNALVDELKSAIEGSEDLKELFVNDDGTYKNEKEVDAWRNSLPLLFQALHKHGLDQIYAAIEYSVPCLEERMDVVLLGSGANDDENDDKILATVVELKQWGRIQDDPDLVYTEVIIPEDPETERRHPCAQLRTYESLLQNNHTGIRDNNIEIDGVAFLHNFQDLSQLFSNQYEIFKKDYEGKVFTDGDSLADYLGTVYNSKDIGDQRFDFLDGEFIISKDVFENIEKFLNEEFSVTIIKEQQKVCAAVTEAIEKLEREGTPDQRLVAIISGSAGTGKSVLGLHLLFWYYKLHGGRPDGIIYSTRNRTLSAVLNASLEGDSHRDMTAHFDRAIKSRNTINFLIVDEAQRLDKLDSLMPELIQKCRILIFLQDDKQIIRINEEGTRENLQNAIINNCIEDVENIGDGQYHALKNGTSVRVLNDLFLKSRLRNGDGSPFGDLIDDFLSDKAPGNYPDLRKKFEIKVEDLKDVDADLNSHRNDGRCKWLAPFCWPWSRSTKKNDIDFYDNGFHFKHPWNPESAREQAEWYKCEDDNSFDQVGCVYTCQGLDFDYVGLIVWDDLVWTGDKWRADLDKNEDPKFVRDILNHFNVQNAKDLKDKDIDEITMLFINTYRILFTRATKGIYIWFKDPTTKDRFMEFLDR